jgi:RNA polymerase sigma factor (sigma-70 family)
VVVERWAETLGDLVTGRGMALKRQAYLLCGDDAQADDLLQEALTRAFARPLRVPGPGGAEAYVRTIMVNLFIDGTRRQSRWRRVAPLLRPAETAPDLAGQVSARDSVLGALRTLSPRQRACVVLRFYEDLPVAGIARALALSEGSVKRYLSEGTSLMAGRLAAIVDAGTFTDAAIELGLSQAAVSRNPLALGPAAVGPPRRDTPARPVHRPAHGNDHDGPVAGRRHDPHPSTHAAIALLTELYRGE